MKSGMTLTPLVDFVIFHIQAQNNLKIPFLLSQSRFLIWALKFENCIFRAHHTNPDFLCEWKNEWDHRAKMV